MKSIFKFLILSFLLLFQLICVYSCKKAESESQNMLQAGDTGQVVFWVSEDVGYINISVDGKNEGTIKGFFYGRTPDCGDSRCLTIELKGGSHIYTSTGNLGTISKSFTVVSNTCNPIKIFGDR